MKSNKGEKEQIAHNGGIRGEQEWREEDEADGWRIRKK